MESQGPIRKAVIPAAGLGTRLLPVTKTVPKEMLPIGERPMIQYSVAEAVGAGITDICIIINERKSLIREYFTKPVSAPLEGHEAIDELVQLVSSCTFTFVDQRDPTGLGDAIFLAKEFVGDEPFAILLPDNVFFSKVPALAQLMRVFQPGKAANALMEVTGETAPLFGNCGNLVLDEIGEGRYRVTEIIDGGPGTFPMVGRERAIRGFPRHIVPPSIFDYIAAARARTTGDMDEIPAMRMLMERDGMVGCLLEGTPFDVGSPQGFRAANAYLLNRDKARAT